MGVQLGTTVREAEGIQEAGQRNVTERSHAEQDRGEQIRAALEFPAITYNEFKSLPVTAQREIISRNRIVNTDTYNRTMDELSSKLLAEANFTFNQVGGTKERPFRPDESEATFAFQMRRSPFGYLIACGVKETIEELTLRPISRAELDFAKEYYTHTKVPFFNEKMWRWVVEENHGVLPFEIHGVKDGTILFPGEPFLMAKGPEELVAHFEQIFHRIFYQTLVATRAHEIEKILGGDMSRFVEVGKRAAITDVQHLMALNAAFIGGGIYLTSDDAGVATYDLSDTGTIGHRYVQRFGDQETAFSFAIENLPAVTLLVDLVDTIQGIDTALYLKQKYRETGKKIWVRLDSGDIKEQVRYFLRETQKLGLTDPLLDRVVVEGIDSLEEMAEIEAMIGKEFGEPAKQRVLYGAGHLLVSEQTTRADASTGLKLALYSAGRRLLVDTMKFSNSPGKESYPGEPVLVVANGKRIVAQMGEQLEGNVMHLFEPLYMQGVRFTDDDTPGEARRRVGLFEETFEVGALSKEQRVRLRADVSEATRAITHEIKRRYGVPLTHAD